jgi:hypothetical protein
MVVVAQLVRASVCGTEGRRFEPGHPPKKAKASKKFEAFFVSIIQQALVRFGKIIKPIFLMS